MCYLNLGDTLCVTVCYLCFVLVRFEDIVLLEDSGVPTEEFLNCCKAMLPFFGEFVSLCLPSLITLTSHPSSLHHVHQNESLQDELSDKHCSEMP